MARVLATSGVRRPAAAGVDIAATMADLNAVLDGGAAALAGVAESARADIGARFDGLWTKHFPYVG